MDGGAWWAAVHRVAKSQIGLSDFTFTIHFHALEKEMATHSSVLAWRIPGMGEPGGLPSMWVAQSRTRLTRFSSSSSRTDSPWLKCEAKILLAALAVSPIQMFLANKLNGQKTNISPSLLAACNARDPASIPGLGLIPWRREWLPTPVFLPGESLGLRSLEGYSPWDPKESDTTEWLSLLLS